MGWVGEALRGRRLLASHVDVWGRPFQKEGMVGAKWKWASGAWGGRGLHGWSREEERSQRRSQGAGEEDSVGLGA